MTTRRSFVAATAATILAASERAGIAAAALSRFDGRDPADARQALKSPTGLAIDQNGDLWVANAGHSSLLPYHNLIPAFNRRITLPQGGFPLSLVVDAAKRICDCDTGLYAILFYSDGDLVHTILIGGRLSGTAVDAAGHVFAVESSSGFVYIFDASGAPLRRITLPDRGMSAFADGGTLYVGLRSNVVVSYDIAKLIGGTPHAKAFAQSGVASPSDLAVDAAHNVYVANMARGVRNVTKYSPAGKLSQVFQPNGNRAAGYEGVAVDAAGNVYISNGEPLNTVTVYDTSGKLIATLR
jgi:sugar lactone lactonase YvrE